MSSIAFAAGAGAGPGIGGGVGLGANVMKQGHWTRCSIAKAGALFLIVNTLLKGVVEC